MITLTEAFTMLEEREYDLPAFFAETGIKGVRDNCHRCPVALFLLSVLTDVEMVDVSTWTTWVIYQDGTSQMMDNPVSVGEFIQDFDELAYPQLVA